MFDKNIAKEFFQEGMADFVDHNYGKSIKALSRSIGVNPEFKLAYMSRGSAYMKLNKIDQAIADYTQAIEIDPEYSKAYHLRGLSHEKNGDNESALHDLSKAIELNPEYGAAYYSRATLYSKMGKEDLAVEDVEMVTHLTEVNIETFANENNIWRSKQIQIEAMDAADPMDR